MENLKIKRYPSKVEFEWNQNLFEPVEDALDIEKSELIQIQKDPMYSLVRNIILPYTGLKSRFIYKDALKLAEIDIIFKACPRSPITPYVPSLLGYTSPLRINTVEIAGKDNNGSTSNGSVEYIQFRYVNSMTVGITKRISSQNLGWDLKTLNPHRLLRFEGSDFSGDILTQWKSFLKMIEGQLVAGADFVSSTTHEPSDWVCFLEFYLTIKTIKEGANAVIRMKTTWTKLMLETIYLASLMFEDVYFFQPIVSGMDSDEIYLVLIQANSEIKEYLHLLELFLERIPQPMDKIEGVLSTNLPDEFLNQMEQIRSDFIQKQIQVLKEIQSYLRLYKEPSLPSLDLSNKLAEWALPDPYE
jgi:hypothetical protein